MKGSAESRAPGVHQRPAAEPEREMEHAMKDKAEEALAEEFTGKVKVAHAIHMQGRPKVPGQRFEVWTPGGERCLVVAHPDPVTAKVVVCLAKAGKYLVKYLVGGQVKGQCPVETGPVTLAIELESWRAEWVAEIQQGGL